MPYKDKEKIISIRIFRDTANELRARFGYAESYDNMIRRALHLVRATTKK